MVPINSDEGHQALIFRHNFALHDPLLLPDYCNNLLSSPDTNPCVFPEIVGFYHFCSSLFMLLSELHLVLGNLRRKMVSAVLRHKEINVFEGTRVLFSTDIEPVVEYHDEIVFPLIGKFKSLPKELLSQKTNSLIKDLKELIQLNPPDMRRVYHGPGDIPENISLKKILFECRRANIGQMLFESYVSKLGEKENRLFGLCDNLKENMKILQQSIQTMNKEAIRITNNNERLKRNFLEALNDKIVPQDIIDHIKRTLVIQ